MKPSAGSWFSVVKKALRYKILAWQHFPSVPSHALQLPSFYIQYKLKMQKKTKPRPPQKTTCVTSQSLCHFLSCSLFFVVLQCLQDTKETRAAFIGTGGRSGIGRPSDQHPGAPAVEGRHHEPSRAGRVEGAPVVPPDDRANPGHHQDAGHHQQHNCRGKTTWARYNWMQQQHTNTNKAHVIYQANNDFWVSDARLCMQRAGLNLYRRTQRLEPQRKTKQGDSCVQFKGPVWSIW